MIKWRGKCQLLFFGCLCQVFVGTFFVFRNSVEKLCRKWVQMRKYQACVFYMPILLRICPSGSAHYLQTFRDKLRNPKEYQQIFCTNPPQYAILISINKRTLVPTYTERKDYDNQSGNVIFLSVGFINCLSPCFLRIPCEIRGRKKYACQSN